MILSARLAIDSLLPLAAIMIAGSVPLLLLRLLAIPAGTPLGLIPQPSLLYQPLLTASLFVP